MKKLLLIMLSSLVLLSVVGCKDDNESESLPPATGQLRAAHFSADAPPADLWVNGTKILSSMDYGTVSAYVTLEAGNYPAQMTISGSNPPVILVDDSVEILANVACTATAAGPLANLTTETFMDDRVTNPTQAKLRFVHVSPDAPSVDIDAPGNYMMFGDLEFATCTTYAYLSAGTYDFVVRSSGTPAVVLNLTQIPLAAGHNYTIFIAGQIGDQTIEGVLAMDA